MAKRDTKRQARKRARQQLVLTEAQMAMGWFVILGLATLLGAIYLSQASRIASTGRRMQVLQDELEALKRENAILERGIAEAQSLERVQEGTARLGFVAADPEDIEYLIVSDYPGEPTAAPTPTPPPARPVESMPEAIWLAIRARIDALGEGEAVETGP